MMLGPHYCFHPSPLFLLLALSLASSLSHTRNLPQNRNQFRSTQQPPSNTQKYRQISTLGPDASRSIRAKCATAKKLVEKLDRLIIKAKVRNENLEDLHKYWKSQSGPCELSNRQLQVVEPKKEASHSPLSHSHSETNAAELIALTGLSGLLTLGALAWVYIKDVRARRRPKRKALLKRRRLTQHLHIHHALPWLEKAEKEKEKSAEEESGKKRAAVKIGLATEILAVNAESIHITAEVIQFLHIMTKIARALNHLGALFPVPMPLEGNKLLTPKQAHGLLKMLEKNPGMGSKVTGTGSSLAGLGGLRDPLKYIDQESISPAKIIQTVINNPAALVLKNLFKSVKKV